MFESHKEVVNALFDVYHDLGTLYCERQYFEKNSTKIQEEAKKKVMEKYGLDDSKEARDLIRSLKS